MIISDQILNANRFAEYYSGKYFSNCDTFDETRDRLASAGIYIKRGYKLSELRDTLSPDKSYVIVSFSTEEDYTQHEYLAMFIQKKYLNRFIRNMNNDI